MKKFATIFGAFLIASVVLTSCAGAGDGWPEDEKKAFMENCVIEGVTTADYCSCMLEKVQKKYPEPEDALNMDLEWMIKEAEDCL
jgi:hypothetical protein